MDAYALHLAIAAVAGASVVAVSAYFIHRKTLTQILDFARSVEKEREREREKEKGGALLEEDGVDGNGGVGGLYYYKRRGHHSRRKSVAGSYGKGSASLPDVTVAGRVGVDEERRNGVAVQEEDYQREFGIPPGLPRLHTLPEGTFERELVLSDFAPE